MNKVEEKATDSKPQTTPTQEELYKQRVQNIRKQVVDGFANFTSRLGINSEMNNQISDSMYTFNMLTRNRIQLEAAYRGSWSVGIMIDAIAEDMTKAGVDITTSEETKNIQEFQACLSRLAIWNSLCNGIKWGRLYGGAIGVLQIEGQDLSTPLNIDRVGKGQFTGITIYDRWQVNPDLTQVIPSGPDMGLPAYYDIITAADVVNSQQLNKEQQNSSLSGSIRVHHSRVVRFMGQQLPFFQAVTEQLWGSSVIERLHDRLIAFDTVTMSAANLINHAHLRTVGVDGLREIMAAGGQAEEGLIKMFEYMRLLQSNEGITLLDKNDMFATTAYTFSGLADMMLQFGQQISGGSGIPLVRFFGQSPSGMNATGESDFKNYYGNINAQQESTLRRPVHTILRVAFKSFFGRPAPNDMQFKFTSLWQSSATDKASVASTTATTVTSTFESGLLSRKNALQELRNVSAETGVFTSITDEDIEAAEKEDDEPPMPETSAIENELSEKLKATDSKFMKALKKTLGL